MVLINMVVAPSCAPQTLAAQPVKAASPPLNPVDQHIVAILRQNGRYGLKVWSLLDQGAVSQNPASRDERRSLRLEAWSRLQRLLHVGMAHRFARKNITATKLPRLSVRRRRRPAPGSTFVESPSSTQQAPSKEFSANWLIKGSSQLAPAGSGQLSESAKAIPAPVSPPTQHTDETWQAEVRSAAQSLARLPRGVKRRLSGYVGSVRPRVGQPILVADDMKAFFGGARRGRAIFCLDATLTLEPGRWGVAPTSSVTILKNQSAVILGQRKKGRAERPSAAKQQAARRNGACPCRPGSRRRGRPRTRWAA
jgi:hypothetical protein